MQVETLLGLVYKLKNIPNSILFKNHNLILKKFKQVLINTCDIPLNQFLNVYFKWDTVVIKSQMTNTLKVLIAARTSFVEGYR